MKGQFCWVNLLLPFGTLASVNLYTDNKTSMHVLSGHRCVVLQHYTCIQQMQIINLVVVVVVVNNNNDRIKMARHTMQLAGNRKIL